MATNQTTNDYLTQMRANGYSEDLIQAALKTVAEAKAKAETKASRKPKAEKTPEQVRAEQLKKLTADLAKLEGVKVATKTFATKVVRKNGSVSLNNEDIIRYAGDKGYSSVFIHAPKSKGSKTDLAYGRFTPDALSNKWIYEGKTYDDLHQAHKVFYPDHTFSKEATLKSAYFAKDGEEGAALKADKEKARLLYKIADTEGFVSRTPVKAISVASAAPAKAAPVADAEESEAEAEESEAAEAEAEEELVFEDEPPVIIPAPAPKAIVFTGKKVPKKAVKA